ncbi:hypothetical protein FQZ97_984290 [compost metagenome]
MAGHADFVAFADVVALGHAQAVLGDAELRLAAALVGQGHQGQLALVGDGLDAGVVARALRLLSLVGEVLWHAVPVPFVGDQRGGEPQAVGQRDEDRAGQQVPGPLGLLGFGHGSVSPK